jgi:hypothetical protein
MLPGGSFINETRPEESYNLPFVLAYALLDQVLAQLSDEGHFKASWLLGARMEAAKRVLPWQGYALIDEGKNRRNDLAHKGEMLSQAECRRYITAIGAELRAFGVLP